MLCASLSFIQQSKALFTGAPCIQYNSTTLHYTAVQYTSHTLSAELNRKVEESVEMARLIRLYVTYFYFDPLVMVINRPGVAGAVLQTAL